MCLGKCKISDNVFVGANAAILNNVKIGSNCKIGICTPVIENLKKIQLYLEILEEFFLIMKNNYLKTLKENQILRKRKFNKTVKIGISSNINVNFLMKFLKTSF